MVLVQDKETNNQAILLNIMIQDIIENCYTEAIEFPIGALILKSITLQLIHCV